MKIILAITIIVLSYNCKAQKTNGIIIIENIIPVEKHINYLENEIEIYDNSYFKDVNDKLTSFEGTWIGNYDNKAYEIQIERYTYISSIRPLKIDKLSIKYKITDAQNNILINTLNFSNDDTLTLKGNYFLSNEETYQVNYVGYECTHAGNLFMATFNAGTQMNLIMIPDSERRCSQTEQAPQIFPINQKMILTKQ